MMHAKNIETPEQSGPTSNDQFAECVKKLSSTDRDFYRRRAAQEDEAAASASCSEARLAHEELAAAYRQLCHSKGAPIDTHLASEMLMFRFNPKPTGQS